MSMQCIRNRFKSVLRAAAVFYLSLMAVLRAAIDMYERGALLHKKKKKGFVLDTNTISCLYAFVASSAICTCITGCRVLAMAPSAQPIMWPSTYCSNRSLTPRSSEKSCVSSSRIEYT